jgi:hypothetical protein
MKYKVGDLIKYTIANDSRCDRETVRIDLGLIEEIVTIENILGTSQHYLVAGRRVVEEEVISKFTEERL